MKTKRQLTTIVAMLMSVTLSAQTYGDYDLYIDVTGNGGAHNTVIYFDDEVSWDPTLFPTYGWDPCCDANSFGVSPGYPQIFTQVVDLPAPPNNHRLSLNGLPHLTEPIDVPFGFIPQALAQYTFSFTELYTLPMGTVVELEDLSLNVTQDLMMDSVYTTWGAESDDEERFVIHFFPSSVTGISDSEGRKDLKAFRNTNQLVVRGEPIELASRIYLFDIQGKELREESVLQHNGGEHRIDIGELSIGIYIVVVEGNNGKRANLKVNI